MSWFQQLVGKLKSVLGRSSAQAKPAIEAAAPQKTETPAGAEKAAESATPTATAVVEKPSAEEKPATTEPAVEEKAAEAEKPAEAEKQVEEPAVATEAVVEEPAAEEPAAVEATEPVAVEAETPAPAAAEPSNPALSTLDNEGRTAELIAEGPYGPGSGKPVSGGAAPSEDFTVKGKESSKLFHTDKSPYFSRTKADVWFKSEADAESAGFQAWDHKKRAAAKK